MTLDLLLQGADIVDAADVSHVEVRRVTRDAEMVLPGMVFVANPYPGAGDRHDLREAARRGAAVLVVDEQDSRLDATLSVPIVVVRGVNRAYATISANMFGNAGRHLRLFGVTGTKGKTTTCHLLESVFRRAGLRTGLISTLVRRIGRREVPSRMTTPDAAQLHKLLATMAEAGVTHVVVEVSSMGLSEDRLHGLRFDGVAFTNLGQDHFDYHGGLAGYRDAKRRLFVDPALHNPGLVSVLNADDPFGAELAAESRGTVITYGLTHGDVKPTDVALTARGLRAVVDGLPIESGLLGAHNLYNVLAAVALAQRVVGAHAAIADGIRDLQGVPGRFERVAGLPAGGVDVVVDYAHTPESVDAILTLADTVVGTRRRVVVIGCRGGSDRAKRAPMTQTALAHSEVCIVTSSNPNVEDPRAILDDMVAGLPVDDLVRAGRLERIVDRRDAIHRAVEVASPDGVVLLLGRGAQPTHAVGHCEIPFDDREVARAAVMALAAGSPLYD